MSKIFDLDFRKGSLIEQYSNNKGVNTNSVFKVTEKGQSLYLDSTADLDGYGVVSGVKTVVMFIKPTANTKILLDDNVDKLEITGGSYSGTGLTQNYVNTIDTDSYNSNQWQCVFSEFSSGISFSTDLEIDPTANIYLSRVIGFDSLLTADERANYYQEFLNSASIVPPKRGFNDTSVEIDVNEGGLVAGYQFAGINANKTLDVKGAYNLTENGILPMGEDGIKFDGDVATLSSTTTPLSGATKFTYHVRINNLSGSDVRYFLVGASAAGTLQAYVSTTNHIVVDIDGLTGGTSDRISLTSDAVIYNDVETDITITYDSSGATAADRLKMYVNGELFAATIGNAGGGTLPTYTSMALGYIGAFSFDGNMVFSKFYNYAKSLSQITKEYNFYANQVSLLENFEGNGADGVVKAPVGMTIGTGTYKIEDISEAEISLLPHNVKRPFKHVCVTAGTQAWRCNQAYGTFEVLGLKSTTSGINFITTSMTPRYYFLGYVLLRYGSTVEIRRVDGTGSSQIKLFLKNNLKDGGIYDFKITRTHEGLTTVYVRGGSFGKTYVLATATTDTNPFTDNTHKTSDYIVADNDPDDYLQGIIVRKGVEK